VAGDPAAAARPRRLAAIRIADGAFLGDAVLNQRSCDHSTLPRPS
jgi:hypothetical protein